MKREALEEGLVVVPEDDAALEDVELAEDGAPGDDGEAPDLVLAALRDAFVDAFNGRDLDGVLAVVAEDIDCPDAPGEGVEALAEELGSIWERSPGAVLTSASLDGRACAVAWLPDEDACWSRAALVCFDIADGQLTLVSLADDPDGLDRSECEQPIGDELDEWLDWAGWEHGEETHMSPRPLGDGRP